MLNCNQPNCKNHKTCTLKEPITPEQLQLNNEIQYWLKELKKAKQRLHQYKQVVKDITIHNKYSTPVNVYGHIEYAPKTNVFGVFIRRPEHVYYGWNERKLQKTKNELIEKIRELRLQELRLKV